MDFDASEFSIDSTFEFPADFFDVLVPDSTLFRNASTGDRITLSMGLVDASASPQTLVHIKEGPIFEYELTAAPNNITGRVRGRDQIAVALDGFFKKRYRRLPIKTVTESVPLEDLDDVPTTTGQFTALDVASEAVASTGLTLQWGVRNYELFTDFEANGRVIDTLRQLVEPWSLVDPFKVDIFVQGSVVVVRSRQFPIVQVDYPMVLADARRSQVTIRKRRTKKVGVLTLRGQAKATTLQTNPAPGDTGIGGVLSSSTQTVEVSSETRGPDGALQTRVVMSLTFRMPDKILIRQVKSTLTYDEVGIGTLSDRETIENEWESSTYDVSGPTNSPKQKNQSVLRERIDPSDDAELFRLWEEELTGYSYDDQGFLKAETTKVRRLDLESGKLTDADLTVKTNEAIAPLLAAQITEKFTFDTDKKWWVLRNRDAQVQGGHLPGGPGRALAQTVENAATQGGAQPVALTVTLSSDGDAIDVEYSNPNLTVEDLGFIASQFQAVQGLWEYEVMFGGVGMPWIRKGVTISFADFLAEDGIVVITLPPLLITEVKSKYDESKLEASMTMNIRAFGWRVT